MLFRRQNLSVFIRQKLLVVLRKPQDIFACFSENVNQLKGYHLLVDVFIEIVSEHSRRRESVHDHLLSFRVVTPDYYFSLIRLKNSNLLLCVPQENGLYRLRQILFQDVSDLLRLLWGIF